MSTVNRDYIVQQIREFVGCHKGCSENFYYGRGCKACAWSEIIGIVENAPTIEPYGTWIPCSERLPEEKINPITQDYYEYPVTAVFGDVKDIRYYKFGNGHWWHGGGIVDELVIAWMPLPEPYREEKKDE